MIFLRQAFESMHLTPTELAATVDVYQRKYNYLSSIQQVKAIRPDILGFVYYNTRLVWGPDCPEYEPEKYQLFVDSNWILKDVNGDYITHAGGPTPGWEGYFVDLGHPGFQAWLANWCKTQVDNNGLNGVSLDNVKWESYWFYGIDWSKPPINPRTGGNYSSDQILADAKTLLQKIRQALGWDKIILCNCLYTGSHFYLENRTAYFMDGLLNSQIDGIMSEGWLTPDYDASNFRSEEDWKKTIDMTIWLENNFPQKGGKYFMLIHTDYSFVEWYSGSSGFPADMTEAQYQEYVLYAFASRLLTVKNLTPIFALGDYIKYPYAQSLFQIDVGDPLGSYYLVAGTHVYARNFTKAKVLVNPSTTSYQVNVNGQTITMASHTGKIISVETPPSPNLAGLILLGALFYFLLTRG